MYPRETELEATIVGVALEKAESELEALRQQRGTSSALAAVNSAKVLHLLEWITAWGLEGPSTPEQWEGFTELVRLVPVSLTTKQHPTRMFRGKSVVALDRAFLRRGTEMEESIPVEELPLFGDTGGSFEWSELTLAARVGMLK